MQQVKMYTPGMFKGEARRQFWKDIKKMEKNGWRVHEVTGTGVGNDQVYTGRLTVVYEK
jgi:hypothetical protein